MSTEQTYVLASQHSTCTAVSLCNRNLQVYLQCKYIKANEASNISDKKGKKSNIVFTATEYIFPTLFFFASHFVFSKQNTLMQMVSSLTAVS